jgi:Ca-activated chloride channel family protein
VSFLWPVFLLALLAVPLLAGLYIWQLRRRKPVGGRFSSLSLIRAAGPSSSRFRRHLPVVLFLAGLAGLAIAVARPVAIVDVPTGQRTVILSLDVSRSMCSTDIQPNRLLAAEDAASQFIQREGSHSQIGIVAFSGFGELIQAPTSDQEVLLDAIDSLTTGQRTAIGSGILEAIDAIADVDPSVPRSVTDGSGGTEPAPVPKGAYAAGIIVLLTDGVSNAGPLPLDAAQQAADRGIRVYTIGFGTSSGGGLANCGQQFIGREPGGGGGFGGGGGGGGGGGFRRGIDEDTLRDVADLTGGKYYSAESAGELASVFADLPTNLIVKHDVVEIGAFFVAAAVVLAGAGLLLSRLWRPLP